MVSPPPIQTAVDPDVAPSRAQKQLPNDDDAPRSGRRGDAQPPPPADISSFKYQARDHIPRKAGDLPSLALSDAQKRNLRDHVHDTLRIAIIAGRFAENDRLNERELATELGVSTTPLKEAFRQLEAEGLIETQPRRGVRIRFGQSWAEEMILARAALESTIAAVAADRVTEEEREGIRSVIGLMESATLSNDVDRLVGLNTQFHDAVHHVSRCQHLTRLVKRQQFYDLSARRIIHRDVAERGVAFEEHSAIARAIVAGRAAKAERLMAGHVRRSGAQYLERVFITGETRRRQLRQDARLAMVDNSGSSGS